MLFLAEDGNRLIVCTGVWRIPVRVNLSRRQSATTAGAPADHARVCLAAPPAGLNHAATAVDQGEERQLVRAHGA
ncbi:hypothetical protein GCM10010406_56100 [Streptomyces thermolineatus]|uniref:Uncharacterized protein n=1 Tax=Streptomyces thermolineatus TaxID=44033 RepID=A0ABN3N2Q9_9ACTN